MTWREEEDESKVLFVLKNGDARATSPGPARYCTSFPKLVATPSRKESSTTALLFGDRECGLPRSSICMESLAHYRR